MEAPGSLEPGYSGYSYKELLVKLIDIKNEPLWFSLFKEGYVAVSSNTLNNLGHFQEDHTLPLSELQGHLGHWHVESALINDFKLQNLPGPCIVLLYTDFVSIRSPNALQPHSAARQIHWNKPVTQFIFKCETIFLTKLTEVCASHSSSNLRPVHSPPICTTNTQAWLIPYSVAINTTLVWFAIFKWSTAITRNFGISWPMCKPQCSCWVAISLLQVPLQVSSLRDHQSLSSALKCPFRRLPDCALAPLSGTVSRVAECDCAQLQPRHELEEVITQQKF